jgi:hypothetical protein
MTQNSIAVLTTATLNETSDYLENIVDILHAARKKDKKIGARLRHFYTSEQQIKVQLTGNGWIMIDTLVAENGISELNKPVLQRVIDSFELKDFA